MFRFLQSSLYSFNIKAPPSSDFIFFGIPYKLKLFVRKFMTSFVSAVLHIFTVGHLLKRSTAIKISTSQFIRLFCSFSVKSICISWPGSVSFFNFSVMIIFNFYLVQGSRTVLVFVFDVPVNFRPPEDFLPVIFALSSSSCRHDRNVEYRVVVFGGPLELLFGRS